MKFYTRHIIKPGQVFSLAKVDPSDTGGIQRREGERKLEKRMRQIGELQELMFAVEKSSVLAIFNGLDGAGKGGAAKMLSHAVVHPAALQAKGFKAPKGDELKLSFIERAVPFEPKPGRIAVFDRSPYEEVTAVKVHPKYLDGQNLPDLVRDAKSNIPESFWDGRVQALMEWEKGMTDRGVVVSKFFFHTSVDVQAQRFKDRLNDKKKNLKFSKRDLTEMEYRVPTLRAWENAMSRTSTARCPWLLVPANHKWYAHLIVADALVHRMRDLRMNYPAMSADELKESLALLKSMTAWSKSK